MTGDESEVLLLQRWQALEEVVRSYEGDPATDVIRDLDAAAARDRLIVHVRIRSTAWTTPDGVEERDSYWFKLDFIDYDEHAPRIWVCDPEDHRKVGSGKQFYPGIPGNGVFNHDTFLCMPGDRRCYETGHHPEWRRKEHYHPDIVIGSLFELIRSPTYQRRKAR